MQLVPGPRQVLREAMILSSAPRGLLALARIWALPGVRVTHRQEVGEPALDGPPALPSSVLRDQTVVDGTGPLLHRTFAVEVAEDRLGPHALVAVLAADMNAVMVPGLARFDRIGDTGHALAVGDEFVVRMPGPWDGPVRVVDRTDTAQRCSFRLATLAGHLEAGQIEFAAQRLGDGTLRFSITTWARAGDLLADLMYNRLGVAKGIQFQLWVHCCVRTAALAAGGGNADGETGVDVVTRTVAWTDDLTARFSGG